MTGHTPQKLPLFRRNLLHHRSARIVSLHTLEYNNTPNPICQHNFFKKYKKFFIKKASISNRKRSLFDHLLLRRVQLLSPTSRIQSHCSIGAGLCVTAMQVLFGKSFSRCSTSFSVSASNAEVASSNKRIGA